MLASCNYLNNINASWGYEPERKKRQNINPHWIMSYCAL